MKITKMTRNWKCFSLYTSPEPLGLTKTKDGLSEREWVVSGVFTVVKYLLFFCVNVCIVHFQSNAVILFYWQIPNKRNTWLLKREPVSPTLPGWKKSKQYRFSVCCKSFRNDAKYNISSYLKMGNIFSSPRGWVHRFHLLGLILQKNNKIWEISNCKCRRSLWICLFFIVFSGRFPLLEAFVPFFFSQVERSNLWYNILGSENTYTVPNRYWASPKTKQSSCSMTIQFSHY